MVKTNTSLVGHDACHNEVEKMKNTARVVMYSLIAASIVAVVGTSVATTNIETTVLASSSAIACGITLFFGWVAVSTRGSECLLWDTKCEGSQQIATGLAGGVNSIASVLGLATVLFMYRAQTGPWNMIMAYVGISVVGSLVAGSLGAFVHKEIIEPVCRG